jgi:hypothetical protein
MLSGTVPFGLQSALFFPERERPDVRNALYVNFTICQPVDEPLTEPREVCFGRGVEGAQTELLDAQGNAIAKAWATPYYFGLSTAGPDACRTPSLSPPNCHEPRALGVSEKTSAGYYYNVPPGNYRIRVFRPGAALSCKLEPAWLGQATAEPNVFQVHAEAAFNNAGVRAFCK